MRQPKRIPICLELFFKNKIIYHFLDTKEPGWAKTLHQNWELIESTWKEYPDLRFGQLLCNLRLIPNLEMENKIWNIEESRWLVENNYIKFEDIQFWGINFFKNGKQRKKTKFVLLRDLKTDHIQNIIKYFEGYNAVHRIPKQYLEYFNKRING